MNPVIFARQLAEVVRRLRELGVRDDDQQLHSKFLNAFQIVLGGSVAQRAAQIKIELPDLEQDVQADIIKDNVDATAMLYMAAHLEDAKLFATYDTIAAQFLRSEVPMVRSETGGDIYRFIKDAPNRFTEAERRGFYARTFGFAQGSVEEGLPNVQFSDLWIRFLSAVSVLVREDGAYVRKAITAQQVFKNARDLAVNLSLHGYGVAYFAAVELQSLIKSTLKTLSQPEVLQAYGVNDAWQLVERVSAIYLGGTVNTVRQRTLAQAGSRIIQWIAAHTPMLVQPGGALDVTHDIELVSNVERWLAVTGTDSGVTSKFAEPVSLPSQPTIPNLQLQMAQDLLGGIPKMNGAGMMSPMTPIGKA